MGSVANKIFAFFLAFAIVAGVPEGMAAAMPGDQDCTMAASCEDPAVPSGCHLFCVAGSPACAATSANVNLDLPHAAPAARPGIPASAYLRAPDTAPPRLAPV